MTINKGYITTAMDFKAEHYHWRLVAKEKTSLVRSQFKSWKKNKTDKLRKEKAFQVGKWLEQRHRNRTIHEVFKKCCLEECDQVGVGWG